MPDKNRRGRPRVTEMRALVNSIFFIAQSGCQWQLLPKEFPPNTTVQRYFYRWRDDGTWQKINYDLVMWRARQTAGKQVPAPQSSVAKYMVKRRGPPSQGWRTFLHNHAPDIAAMDLFVVPTIGFDLLYAFVIVRLGRRDLVWINVTAYPTADWVARQLAEAFPWNEAPRYMIRDRDRIYGAVVTRRLRAMGIRDKPAAPASPWQNGVAERLVGSIRRESVDHMIVLGEAI